MSKYKAKAKRKTKEKKDIVIPELLVWLYALSSLAFIPLFYYKPAVDVTLIPKLMVLGIMLLLFVLIFLIFDKLRLPPSSLLKQWPVLLWVGFSVVTVISVFGAINPQEGLFDIIKVIFSLIFLIVTTALLIRARSITPFIISAVLMTIVLSLVGLNQYFNHAFREADLNMLYKVDGLMSHKNVLSGILFMALPLLCYSQLTTKFPQKLISGAAMFLSIVLLILIQTRSIWLSIITFIVISIVLGWLYRNKIMPANKSKLKQNIITASVIILLAFTTATLINSYSVKHQIHSEEVKSYEQVEHIHKRAASVFDTSTPNRVKRLDIWARTFEMFTDHPVLGVGAGNWKINAPNYYKPNPDEWHYHNWRRPHNDYLWVLSEKGLPGFLFFIGFFISLLVLTLKILAGKVSASKKILVITAMAGIAGYCVDAMFAFPYERVDLQVFLMFFASLILWIHFTSRKKKIAGQRKYRRSFLFISAIILLFSINATHKMIRAEVYTNNAYFAYINDQYKSVIHYIDKGYNNKASLDPTNHPMYWYRGNANLRLENYYEAKDDLKLALQHNPFSILVLNDLGTIYHILEDYDKAAEFFSEGIRIYPRNVDALRGLGMTYVAMGKYQEALELYYRSMRDPDEPILNALINQAHMKMREENN